MCVDLVPNPNAVPLSRKKRGYFGYFTPTLPPPIPPGIPIVFGGRKESRNQTLTENLHWIWKSGYWERVDREWTFQTKNLFVTRWIVHHVCFAKKGQRRIRNYAVELGIIAAAWPPRSMFCYNIVLTSLKNYYCNLTTKSKRSLKEEKGLGIFFWPKWWRRRRVRNTRTQVVWLRQQVNPC